MPETPEPEKITTLPKSEFDTLIKEMCKFNSVKKVPGKKDLQVNSRNNSPVKSSPTFSVRIGERQLHLQHKISICNIKFYENVPTPKIGLSFTSDLFDDPISTDGVRPSGCRQIRICGPRRIYQVGVQDNRFCCKISKNIFGRITFVCVRSSSHDHAERTIVELYFGDESRSRFTTRAPQPLNIARLYALVKGGKVAGLGGADAFQQAKNMMNVRQKFKVIALQQSETWTEKRHDGLQLRFHRIESKV